MHSTGTQRLDCDHCGRTSYWCHCDTHPAGARRACKRERKEYGLDLSIPLYADPDLARMVRSRIVPGRVK